jgi:hypothetical protein
VADDKWGVMACNLQGSLSLHVLAAVQAQQVLHIAFGSMAIAPALYVYYAHLSYAALCC